MIKFKEISPKAKSTFRGKEGGHFSQYEKCVICGIPTKVLRETPIDCRQNYIYGCGQLCERCASTFYKEERKGFR